MDPITRLRNEHSLILKHMEEIGALFLDPDPARLEDLRDRLKKLWVLVMRHELFEEEWMSGSCASPPGTELDSLLREHGDILSYLASLEEVLADLRTYSHHYWRRTADRETIHAQVEQVFRFLREHMRREESGILLLEGKPKDAAGGEHPR